MSNIERKRKAFHKEIRSNFLQEYFSKIRNERLRELRDYEQEVEQDIETFMNAFPKKIEIVSKYNISGLLLERMVGTPHYWLQDHERWLNMCEWTCFIQLILKILCKIDEKDIRLRLLHSSQIIICSHFKKRLSQNKLMKRHILTMILDISLQISQEIIIIQGQYLQTLKIVINELLGLNFQQYANQMIKAFAICNRLIGTGQQQVEKLIDQVFINERWVIFKILTFIQQFGFIYKSQMTSALLKIVLVFLTNLTQQTKNSRFYEMFMRSSFLQVIHNVFEFPNDFMPGVLKLYLKLIFNLIIQSRSFAMFINQTINFNKIYAKIQSEEEQMLLKDIQVLLQQVINKDS